MPLSEVILVSMALLTLAIVAAGLLRNFSIPYTVLLVVIGIGLAEWSRVWEPLQPLQFFTLSPDLVFFIFLPALIFESGLSLNARQLLRDLAPILTLAVPALLISTTLIGFTLAYLLPLDLAVALLFGALISATDPVAVVALFKELGAPVRLNVLVEGESLFNDATAIVVFGILLTLALEGSSVGPLESVNAIFEFIRVFVGGAVLGIVMGMAVSELLHRLASGVSAILTMSIVAAYASFIIGEHSLHVSGVMATVGAAVTLNVYGLGRIGIDVRDSLGETWEFIGLVANSLLFLLVGLSINIESLFSHLDLILLTVVIVQLARAGTVYSLVPVTTRWFKLPKITLAERHIMWWGGLKGGLAIAIVLSIPEGLMGRDLLINLTLGVVLFTLIINAWTIRPLMHALKLDRFSEDERLELDQGLKYAGKVALERMQMYRDCEIASDTLEAKIEQQIEQGLLSHRPRIDAQQSSRELYLQALRQEIELVNRLHEVGVIDQYTLAGIRNNLQSDREAHSSATRDRITFVDGSKSVFARIETWVVKHLREKNWAVGWLARYQRLRLGQQVRRNLARVIMAHVVLEYLLGLDAGEQQDAQPIIDAYRRRLETSRNRLHEVRHDFPDFYRDIESELFMRSSLVAARLGIEQHHHHGQIGVKAYNRILSLIEQELRQCTSDSAKVERIDIGSMANLPLFQGLSHQALELLRAHAQEVTFLAGDIIIGEGEHGDALYIIEHGEAIAYQQDEQGREKILGTLAADDFFGEMALLGDHVRTASVKAKTAVTSLRLRRSDVMRVAKQHEEVQRRIEQVRDQRLGD